MAWRCASELGAGRMSEGDITGNLSILLQTHRGFFSWERPQDKPHRLSDGVSGIYNSLHEHTPCRLAAVSWRKAGYS